jgi:hypothetical protein
MDKATDRLHPQRSGRDGPSGRHERIRRSPTAPGCGTGKKKKNKKRRPTNIGADLVIKGECYGREPPGSTKFQEQ